MLIETKDAGREREKKEEKGRERERKGEKVRKRKRKGEKGRKRKRKREKRASTNEIIRIKDSHGVKKASRAEFKLESLDFHTKNDNKNRKAEKVFTCYHLCQDIAECC